MICPKCNKEIKDGLNVCDKCGKSLVRRTDDNEKSFRNRFDTFLRNNEPIMEFYKCKNKLHIVDTKIGKENITDKIKDILKWLVLKVIEK